MRGSEDISSKEQFYLKEGIFGPKLAQNGPNVIFRTKSKNVTSVALESPNFVPNFRKFLKTDSEISEIGCEFIGSASYRREPKTNVYLPNLCNYNQLIIQLK